MSSTQVTAAGFLIDGKPFRIFSGAIHYFRVHPDLWQDRLAKLKALGLNTVETYVAWNLHEPQPGQFEFTGFTDIVKFLQLADRMGLKAIVRPGPYICAEWEFGGLPAWLLNIPGMRLRCNNPPFLAAVKRFYDELLQRLKPLLYTKGGPIIAMQVENEYGSYGDDKEYLNAIRQMYVDNGVDVVHFTSDGACDWMLQGGMIPGVWETVNFGSRAEHEFANLKKVQPELPLMCTEFWNGWFDHWTEPHHSRYAPDAADQLQAILAAGANVNLYMFHGGTNFGFMNGANRPGLKDYQPTVNSYDYDSPLSEAGDPTEKYYLFRDVIARFNPDFDPATPVPPASKKIAYGTVKLTQAASLLDQKNLLGLCNNHVYHCAAPECMERFGQNYGFIFYHHRLTGPLNHVKLTVQEPRDRAQVFLDGKPIATMYCNDANHEVIIDVPAAGADLDILVENMGRTNYGSLLEDSKKGISTGVRVEGRFLFGWAVICLPLTDLGKLEYKEQAIPDGVPAFYRGELEIDEVADTFVRIPGGVKGVCWINGFNLGRYWQVGPQKTSYIPAPLLKRGRNVIEVLELHQLGRKEAVFSAVPEL